jgi:uncharacterized protein YbaP (TraB family)
MCIKLPRLKPRLKLGKFIVVVFLQIFSQLAFSQPAASAELGDEAQGVFWQLEKDGETAGYLLGTIHSEDPRVLEFSEQFLGKLNSCDVFAMEMVPDTPTLHKLTKYMNFQDGKTLLSVIGEERFSMLTNAMAGYRLPADFLVHMKPWAAMLTLSTPPPKTGFFMDLSLSLRASGNSLSVVGLETLEQQLSFLENMPIDMQISLLDQAITEAGRVEQMQLEMVDAYLENNLQHLQSLTDEELQTAGEEARDYFNRYGIEQRNQRMMSALLPMLETSKVFVAVGALHLPGQLGLLNLLSDRGYKALALPLPFAQGE